MSLFKKQQIVWCIVLFAQLLAPPALAKLVERNKVTIVGSHLRTFTEKMTMTDRQKVIASEMAFFRQRARVKMDRTQEFDFFAHFKVAILEIQLKKLSEKISDDEEYADKIEYFTYIKWNEVLFEKSFMETSLSPGTYSFYTPYNVKFIEDLTRAKDITDYESLHIITNSRLSAAEIKKAMPGDVKYIQCRIVTENKLEPFDKIDVTVKRTVVEFEDAHSAHMQGKLKRRIMIGLVFVLACKQLWKFVDSLHLDD